MENIYCVCALIGFHFETIESRLLNSIQLTDQRAVRFLRLVPRAVFIVECVSYQLDPKVKQGDSVVLEAKMPNI